MLNSLKWKTSKKLPLLPRRRPHAFPRKISSFPPLNILTLIIIALTLFVSTVQCDIADCRTDADCRNYEDACCARVQVTDPMDNKIDSHYCLQKYIIENLGNRYYFKGILAQAYCDQASLLTNGMTGAIIASVFLMYQMI